MNKVHSDSRGLPTEAGIIPDYTGLVEATDRFVRQYPSDVRARRKGRERLWIDAARAPHAARALAKRSAEVRAALQQALGGAFEPVGVELTPELVRTSQLVVAAGADGVGPQPPRGHYVVRRYQLAGAARPKPVGPGSGRSQDLAFLEIRNRQNESGELALLIGDAEAHLLGGQSPETVAARWGYRLASAGYAVVIADLPSLRNVCSTRNKALLVQGRCVPGELVDETERVLAAALAVLPRLRPQRVWLGGVGLGGLVALMLTVLDRRVFGCISVDAPRRGDLDWDETLAMPSIHRLTDMADVAAATAPAALAIVQEGLSPWGPRDFSLGWVDRAARAARRLGGAYVRLDSRADAEGVLEKLLRWMRRRSAEADRSPAAADNRPVSLPREARVECFVSVASVKSLARWRRRRARLRRAFLEVMGLPRDHRPHCVVPIAADELEDCFREEVDVYSSPWTGAKVLLLRPKTPKVTAGPNPAVLCLPGSSSDAGQVEAAYAHEVVARGFTAVIIDSRARLYRHFQGARRGRVVVAQSVYDQLCVMDYLVGRADVDGGRIGTMGLSQGGIHSWMLAALDERISAAAPVCGLSTYQATIEDVRDDWYDGSFLSFLDSHTFYVYPPGLLRHGDVGDLMGLIAPRPLAILGGTHDHVFPLRGIRRIHRDLKRLYSLYGAVGDLDCHLIDARHSMPPKLRRRAYRFFEAHL